MIDAVSKIPSYILVTEPEFPWMLCSLEHTSGLLRAMFLDLATVLWVDSNQGILITRLWGIGTGEESQHSTNPCRAIDFRCVVNNKNADFLDLYAAINFSGVGRLIQVKKEKMPDGRYYMEYHLEVSNPSGNDTFFDNVEQINTLIKDIFRRQH
jgi:hypothetical protein